ncbi:hypothetical protein Rwratislav_32685, partial [Rhodococcus wratislaviensis IFP 2016]
RLRVGRLIGAHALVTTRIVAAVAVVTVSIFGHRITSISRDRPQGQSHRLCLRECPVGLRRS